ncbi:MAG: AMP-binding protein, partial [Pseudomonadota bacterium]
MTAKEQSYVCGVSDAPLIYKTIGQTLDEAVRRYGDRPALIVRHQNVQMSYAEFASAVDDFAAGLHALGLKQGDRIGIWSPNNAEWVIAQFATAKLGLILVNINPAYRTSELDYVLNKVGARALILARSFKTSDYAGMVRSLGAEKLPLLEEAIVISDAPVDGFRRFSDIAALATAEHRARVREIGEGLSPDDPVNIQFTSGTTGFPKGATLTHVNIVNNGRFVGARQRFTQEDRLCIPVPLYHCFGMVMAVLACVTHGAAMVFSGEAFEPASVLDAIEREKCTALYGVPTMFIAELDHPSFKGRDLSSLRTGVMAGAPCPEAVMRRVITDMHMRDVTICYGMTETSPVSFQSMPDDTLDKRVTTVGAIHPFVEVKIVDTDGKMTPRGVQGELLTRGYSVMRGYWGDAEKTREAIDEA